jgi:hypothetical protein
MSSTPLNQRRAGPKKFITGSTSKTVQKQDIIVPWNADVTSNKLKMNNDTPAENEAASLSPSQP